MDIQICIIEDGGKDPVPAPLSSSLVQVRLATTLFNSFLQPCWLLLGQELCFCLALGWKYGLWQIKSVSTVEPQTEFKKSDGLLILSQEAKEMI